MKPWRRGRFEVHHVGSHCSRFVVRCVSGILLKMASSTVLLTGGAVLMTRGLKFPYCRHSCSVKTNSQEEVILVVSFTVS